jgi:hypothetical protein
MILIPKSLKNPYLKKKNRKHLHGSSKNLKKIFLTPQNSKKNSLLKSEKIVFAYGLEKCHLILICKSILM